MLVAASLLVATAAQAQVSATWNPTVPLPDGSFSYNNPSNWSPQQVPTNPAFSFATNGSATFGMTTGNHVTTQSALEYLAGSSAVCRPISNRE